MDTKQAEVDDELDEVLRDYQDRLTCGVYEAIYDLDEASRDAVMRCQAQTCVAAFLDFAGLPRSMRLESFRDAMRDAHPLGGDIRQEGNVMHWTGNQRGQCACPLVRRGVIRLDPKLCACSAYWVKYLFDKVAHTPVDVQIMETVATGGHACTFKITLK